VYVDTSVYGGCEEDNFQGPSRRLMDLCRRGEMDLVVSEVLLDELRPAPKAVRDVLRRIGPDRWTMIEEVDEIEALARRYIESGALSPKMYNDALHIAVATVGRVDYLASWNFRHMLDGRRARMYDEVNRQAGYPPIKIRNPQDIENEHQKWK